MDEDNRFGPQLLGVFDFTILFEQSILSLLPQSVFLLLGGFRIYQLIKHAPHMKDRSLLWAKLIVTSIYGGTQIALLALWVFRTVPRTAVSIAEPAVGVGEGLMIATLSSSQHLRSSRPSLLLNGYLLLSIILNIPLARSLWIRPDTQFMAIVLTFSLAIKTLMLLLEEAPKSIVRAKGGIAKESRSGFISRTVFWWLNSLFVRGFRHLLDVDCLGDIDSKFDSDKLLRTLERRWSKDTKSSPVALLKCTFLAFKWQFMAGIFPRLLHSGFGFAQPFLIKAVIAYVGNPNVTFSSEIAAGLIGATALVYLGLAATAIWHKHMSYQLVTMWRGGLISLIYKKTLELGAESIKDTAPVTLMATDMDTIVVAGESLHDMWCSFVDLPVGIYLLYRQIGPPSLFALVPSILTTVISAIIAPAMEPATVKWNAAVQKRVGKSAGMLSQMKGIKMMGLTDYFHSLIHSLRLEELKISHRFRSLMVRLMVLSTISSEITPVLIVVSAIYWTKAGEGLTIGEAFTSLSIISLVTQPLVLILGSMIQIAGVFGSFMRIQDFLLLEEQKDLRRSAWGPVPNNVSSLRSPSESTLGLSTLLAPQATQCSNVNQINQCQVGNETPAIIFNRATFKSSSGDDLLQDINLQIPQGTLTIVTGRVGCGKSSLLKAIVGELIPSSGHITLADPCIAYCDQTPWLQNSSIQDNIVGKSIMEDKWFSHVVSACALQEDLTSFPLGDQTVVGSGGLALSGGQRQRIALARAVYQRREIVVLDDIFSGLDNRTSQTIFQRLLGPTGLLRQSNKTVILATSNVHFLSGADYITILRRGRIARNQVPYHTLELDAWGTFDHSEPNEREDTVDDTDYEDNEDADTIRHDNETKEEKGATNTDGDTSRQTGDWGCYRIYLNALGWKLLALVFGLMLFHTGLEIMPQIWLRLWTERAAGARDAGWTAGYVGFAIASILFGSLALGIFIIVGIPKSAAFLHEGLLKSVCRAPLHFFTTTDNGLTLNRFSQDMRLLDQILPLTFYMSLGLLLRAIAQTGIIVSGATFVGIFIPLSFVLLYFIQKFYLRTSRQMRFLDLEMKSPLYTHFTETLAGLSTIRAFGWSHAFLDENTKRLNTSQKPFYLMFCIQRWLQVVLDLFVAGMALVLVSLALCVVDTTSQGAIGLAMVNLLGFNHTLKLVIDQWTQLETSLGAVARLKTFMRDTPCEDREGEKKVPESDWTQRGDIEFENVSASYNDYGDMVLNNISVKIQPGQKVCICGRTGSGKSSMIVTLLRLTEIRYGTVRVGDVDISTVPRQHVRSSLTTIPQDPVCLGRSVRHNLDPQDLVQSDELLIEVLRKATLWPTIESRGGLDADAAELGFSVGQMQLFALARALLSRNRIVLLDEATSSVDRTTDEEIRRIIKDELADRTVLEVAHRLEIVREFDMVIVMGQGKIIETGSPDELLARPSELRRLFDSRGV